MKHIINYVKRRTNDRPTVLLDLGRAVGVMTETHRKLSFAEPELRRMENEGGIPLDDMKIAKTESYFKSKQPVKKNLLQHIYYCEESQD